MADESPGIDPADLDRLFQLFPRLASGARKPGMGLALYLALYIVDAIVRAHGGRVWDQSAKPGHGTVFTADLTITAVASALRRRSESAIGEG